MTAPQRVQLSRRKGWRKPENTVVVARPSTWGNPFRVGENALTRADAVEQFRELVTDPGRTYAAFRENVRDSLAGKNLACWCPPGEPCHADVLLEIANGPSDAAPAAARTVSIPAWIALCDTCPWRSPAARESEADADADRDRHNYYAHGDD